MSYSTEPRAGARPVLARGLSWLAILLLYVLGLAHWTLFFNWGHIAFLENDDWSKEFDYYVVLQEALRTGRVPYHMTEPWQGTDRFLALPETNLSPQVLLLPYLEIGRFLWLNTLLLYSLGFAGCLLIRRRYRLGLVPFTALFLLFGFNGFLTSHLSVGHSMWVGYFLLSFAALYVLEMIEEPHSSVPALKLALVLFVMMLQGFFHAVIWVWLLLILWVIFNPGRWKQGGLVLAFGGWLSCFRLLPAALTFWGKRDRGFWAGYPGLTEVVDGLIGLHGKDYPEAGEGWVRSPLIGHALRYCEYDMYVGPLGLAVLVFCGVYLRFRDGPAWERYRYRALDGPLLVLAFLSLNYFYLFVASLPIPLFNAEAVTSRFLIIPVVLLLVISSVRMQRLLEGVKPTAPLLVLLAGMLLQTAFSLAEHSYAWRIKPAEAEVAPKSGLADHAPEPWYFAGIYLSAAASLAGALAWWYVFRRARRSAAGGSER